jgi:hypothetical protein
MGGGDKCLKFRFIHPHPGPLPSRERELLDYFRDRHFRNFELSDLGIKGYS